MKLFSLLFLFLGLALASCNLLQFGDMIKKKTEKSWLAYNGYGCCCGWGGSKQPLDATDCSQSSADMETMGDVAKFEINQKAAPK